MQGGYVYILASRPRGAIYAGVTSDMAARMMLHREGSGSRHAAKYGINRLVFVEAHGRIEDAIVREKRIKKWRRAWKLELIESVSPAWDDLLETINT